MGPAPFFTAHPLDWPGQGVEGGGCLGSLWPWVAACQARLGAPASCVPGPEWLSPALASPGAQKGPTDSCPVEEDESFLGKSPWVWSQAWI